MPPREQQIGPDLVRKTIRQAYARAGPPYTCSHLLRHTMTSRLLAGGFSLKEVADVLRHRSLNTTLVYAKLDSRRLVEVALPWPDPRTWARRLKHLRSFTRWLQQFEPSTEVPDDTIFGRLPERQAPHIYSDEEVRQAAARRLGPQPGLRGMV